LSYGRMHENFVANRKRAKFCATNRCFVNLSFWFCWCTGWQASENNPRSRRKQQRTIHLN